MNAIDTAQHIGRLEWEFNTAACDLATLLEGYPHYPPGGARQQKAIALRDRTRAAYLAARKVQP